MTQSTTNPVHDQSGTPPADPPKAPKAKAPVLDPEIASKIVGLEESLRQTRAEYKASADELTRLKATTMSEQEKAVAAARAEGHSEALLAAGKRLAAAEFRAQAAGKLADPGAAVEYLDMARFVREDGEPNLKAIATAVEKLVSAAGAVEPANGKHLPTLPQGPRGETEGGQDWIQAALHGTRQ